MMTFNSVVKKILNDSKYDNLKFSGWLPGGELGQNKSAVDSLIGAYTNAITSNVDPAAPVKDRMSKITQGNAQRARQIAGEIDNIIRHDTSFGDYQTPDVDALRSIHAYVTDYLEGITGQKGY